MNNKVESFISFSDFFNNENSEVIEISSDNGKGTMYFNNIMPGIIIIFNDFHMNTIKSDYKPNTDMLCFDHCREGRIEQEIKPGKYRSIESGDLRIDNRINHNTNFCFPLSNYHGITIVFEIQLADKSIKNIFPDFPVSIRSLREKYCSNDNAYYLRGDSAIDHIFSELYNVPQDIKEYYYKIKMLELLLFLGGLETNNSKNEKPYFFKSQTEKVKAIHKLITSDLQKHYTLEDLSKKFSISLTGMKNCFKTIYGLPIYSYIKKYKMNRAATLLKTTKISIAEIANGVGYESPSKFSAAFKKEMDMLPLEYRNTRGFEMFL